MTIVYMQSGDEKMGVEPKQKELVLSEDAALML